MRREAPVASSRAVTVAPTTAAPVLSVTIPERVLVAVWARAATAAADTRTLTAMKRCAKRSMALSLAAEGPVPPGDRKRLQDLNRCLITVQWAVKSRRVAYDGRTSPSTEPGMPAQYRADQVGSFLRPPELLQVRRSPTADPEGRRALEDRHIRRILERQKELGFEVFTDGELRRRNFMSDFTDAVEGFDFGDSVARTWAAGGSKGPEVSKVAGIVTSRLRPVRPLTGYELSFLKEHKPGAIKMTLPSATQFPAISYKWGVSDQIYKDPSALLWDIVEIMKTELSRLSADGVEYIQIDAPRYSYF